VDEHFWHAQKCFAFLAHRKTKFSLCPKNPLSKENSVKQAPLGAGRSFLWIFMIFKLKRFEISY